MWWWLNNTNQNLVFQEKDEISIEDELEFCHYLSYLMKRQSTISHLLPLEYPTKWYVLLPQFRYHCNDYTCHQLLLHVHRTVNTELFHSDYLQYLFLYMHYTYVDDDHFHYNMDRFL